MKTNKYILFCLFLLYLLPVKATDITKDENKYVTISGIVKDKSDKRTLSYANVSIAGSTESTVTNADGEFTFNRSATPRSKYLIWVMPTPVFV